MAMHLLVSRTFALAALAAFLVAPPASSSLPLPSPAITGSCSATAFRLGDSPHWNGWGNDLQQRRFQSALAAGIDPRTVGRLRLKWAFAFPGANQASSQPAVAGGRLFVGSANGSVYALDARTGCTYWEFRAATKVRTAISIGPVPSGWAVFFGIKPPTRMPWMQAPVGCCGKFISIPIGPRSSPARLSFTRESCMCRSRRTRKHSEQVLPIRAVRFGGASPHSTHQPAG